MRGMEPMLTTIIERVGASLLFFVPCLNTMDDGWLLPGLSGQSQGDDNCCNYLDKTGQTNYNRLTCPEQGTLLFLINPI
jgi:hypothetical protein